MVRGKIDGLCGSRPLYLECSVDLNDWGREFDCLKTKKAASCCWPLTSVSCMSPIFRQTSVLSPKADWCYFVPSYPSDMASASASAASYSANFSASVLSTMLLLLPEPHPSGATSKQSIPKVSIQVFINPSNRKKSQFKVNNCIPFVTERNAVARSVVVQKCQVRIRRRSLLSQIAILGLPKDRMGFCCRRQASLHDPTPGVRSCCLLRLSR